MEIRNVDRYATLGDETLILLYRDNLSLCFFGARTEYKLHNWLLSVNT